MCKRVGIDRELLPPIHKCSDVIGELTTDAARACGLRPGTPVVAGGLDAACTALGVGAIHPGEVQEQGGQAGGMSIVVDSAASHRKLILGRHVIAGKWLLQGGTVGGGSLRWLRRELAREFEHDEDFYEVVHRELPTIPAGSGGLVYLPYMAGERSPIWDVDARGVFLGYTATTLGAAMLPGLGIGTYKDAKDTVQQTVRIQHVYEPEPRQVRIYDHFYAIYREAYERLQDLFPKVGVDS